MDTEYCKNVYDKLSSAYMSTPFMAYNTMTASALSSADSVDSHQPWASDMKETEFLP